MTLTDAELRQGVVNAIRSAYETALHRSVEAQVRYAADKAGYDERRKHDDDLGWAGSPQAPTDKFKNEAMERASEWKQVLNFAIDHFIGGEK